MNIHGIGCISGFMGGFSTHTINFFKSLEPIFIQKNEDMFTDIVQSEKQQQDDILAFLEM